MHRFPTGRVSLRVGFIKCNCITQKDITIYSRKNIIGTYNFRNLNNRQKPHHLIIKPIVPVDNADRKRQQGQRATAGVLPASVGKGQRCGSSAFLDAEEVKTGGEYHQDGICGRAGRCRDTC